MLVPAGGAADRETGLAFGGGDDDRAVLDADQVEDGDAATLSTADDPREPGVRGD